jgi:phosphate transport system permease protein
MTRVLEPRQSTVDTPPSPPPSTRPLATRTLDRGALITLAVAVPVLVLALLAATDSGGVASFVVLSVVGYVAASTGLSLIVEGRRRALDRLCTAVMYGGITVAVLPLVLIVWHTLLQGIQVIDLTFVGHSMFRVNPENPGGGVYHAIVGTLIQSALAAALAVPLGLLTAIYLTEYGRGRRFARIVGLAVDVIAGVPSIVAGLFVFSVWILALGFGKSGLAGALALTIVMLPVVVRSTEQMLRLVPEDLREASYALGIRKWRTIVSVVLPTAMGGIVTGVMLGVARVAGETAPLLLLVGINQRIEFNPFAGQSGQRPQESLPTLIFEQFGIAAGNTDSPPFQRAWGAAVVLIVIIGLLNLLARLIARFFRVRG